MNALLLKGDRNPSTTAPLSAAPPVPPLAQLARAAAADRGEARAVVENRIATLPTALFRNELFLARTPPSEGTLVEIVDDVFLPLVRPEPGEAGA